jgi:transcriptional regulator with XRE-family HTH domain
MDLVELGKRVRSLRVERGMTLQGLAQAASVSVSMLSSVERGQKAATVVVLARIAEGLGVPLAGLVAALDDRVIVRRLGTRMSSTNHTDMIATCSRPTCRAASDAGATSAPGECAIPRGRL